MAHGAALRPGVSVMKEIVIASGLGLATASVWKMWHWNHMRRTETFYADLARSEAAKN
jgi:hypothetical protein